MRYFQYDRQGRYMGEIKDQNTAYTDIMVGALIAPFVVMIYGVWRAIIGVLKLLGRIVQWGWNEWLGP